MKKILTFTLLVMMMAGCVGKEKRERIANTLRAPAYPLVTIDPYTSAWSFTDKLYDAPVKHWTGVDFPLIGAIRVDGQIYRFMGVEKIPLQRIVSMAQEAEWTGAYTFKSPGKDWEKPDFNDSQWERGQASFGTPEETAVRTLWTESNSDIWVRREIDLNGESLGKNLYLEYSHDDDFELYINGVEVVNTGYAYKKNVIIPLPDAALQTLRPGINVMAAHCHNRMAGALVDFGLSADISSERYLDRTAEQKSVDVQAMQTHYAFVCGPVDLELTFTAPLFLDRPDLLSRPVNYISYNIKSNDDQAHEISVYFEATPDWALDKESQDSESEIIEDNHLVYLKTGSAEQSVLGKKGDNVRIDWGYFYLAGEKVNSVCSIDNPFVLRLSFDQSGTLSPDGVPEGRNHLAIVQSFGKTKEVSDKVMIGYDDLYSVQYFGENLYPYWNANGTNNICRVFDQACEDFPDLIEACDRFDHDLMETAIRSGGKEYAELCALAYRQAIAAHKLAVAPNGDLLFLSKENFSNGSIGTVDVTYPSAPLFLLYNPEIAKGLLNFIFYYSESGQWNKPYPSHDVGTYPVANGQTYGGDMPVEEAGNMLILTAAIAAVEGNALYAQKHWDVLTVWANYLAEKGLDPENQLCTDDFAGHFAHNANLSVKAILGIASYGRLAEMLGKKEIAAEYTAKAKAMAAEWMKMDDDGDHYRLTFDQPDTWSQKYNLVWNKLLKMNIFPGEIADKEIPYYLTKQNQYGLPLDNRETYTKSDWIIWTATLTSDQATFQQFITPVHQFMNETTNRVPMTDWYWTDKPQQRGFQARSVVGGYYIKMLEDKLNVK